MRIIAFHLLNDYSGSPRVLRTVLEGMLRHGDTVELHTSRGGCLDPLADEYPVTFHDNRYRFDARSRIATAMRFIAANVRYLMTALRTRRGDDTIFYCNTLLTIGAMAGARLRGHRCILHLHENAGAKGSVYRMLQGMARRLADGIICVSQAQADELGVPEKTDVIPNAIPDALLPAEAPDPRGLMANRRVMMTAPFRDYKGVREFRRLAELLPDVQLEFVANCRDDELAAGVREYGLDTLPNITVTPRQNSLKEVYGRSSAVINMSNPDLFVETFGMSLLEGMGNGLPAIGPCVGGPRDLIEEGVNGFHCDGRNPEEAAEKIRGLLADERMYARLSAGAYATALRHSETLFDARIRALLLR